MQDRAIPLPAERESDLRAAVRRFFKVAEYHCGLGRMLCRDTCPRHRALRDMEKSWCSMLKWPKNR